MLFKVVGVADLDIWRYVNATWQNLIPTIVKKLVTERENAEKKEVAEALSTDVNQQLYATDDESDAVAVGLAWLYQHTVINPKEQEGVSSRL